jgi:hypothetical protein
VSVEDVVGRCRVVPKGYPTGEPSSCTAAKQCSSFPSDSLPGRRTAAASLLRA